MRNWLLLISALVLVVTGSACSKSRAQAEPPSFLDGFWKGALVYTFDPDVGDTVVEEVPEFWLLARERGSSFSIGGVLGSVSGTRAELGDTYDTPFFHNPPWALWFRISTSGYFEGDRVEIVFDATEYQTPEGGKTSTWMDHYTATYQFSGMTLDTPPQVVGGQSALTEDVTAPQCLGGHVVPLKHFGELSWARPWPCLE